MLAEEGYAVSLQICLRKGHSPRDKDKKQHTGEAVSG